MVSCSRGGHAAGAAEVFETMLEAGVAPDQVSYNIMIDAFGRAGLSDGKSSLLVLSNKVQAFHFLHC
jgi:pentatricopeptide repeat protein